jgi:hypothetical protein
MLEEIIIFGTIGCFVLASYLVIRFFHRIIKESNRLAEFSKRKWNKKLRRFAVND